MKKLYAICLVLALLVCAGLAGAEDARITLAWNVLDDGRINLTGVTLVDLETIQAMLDARGLVVRWPEGVGYTLPIENCYIRIERLYTEEADALAALGVDAKPDTSVGGFLAPQEMVDSFDNTGVELQINQSLVLLSVRFSTPEEKAFPPELLGDEAIRTDNGFVACYNADGSMLYAMTEEQAQAILDGDEGLRTSYALVSRRPEATADKLMDILQSM